MTEENKDMAPEQPQSGEPQAAAPQEQPQSQDASATYTVPAGKVPADKRIIAYLIDLALTFVAGLIPVIGWIAGAVYWLVRDGLDVDFMDHRSLGKKIMKLRPVTLDGKPLTVQDSLRRNWPFAVGGLAVVPVIGWFVLLPIALILGIIEAVLVLTDDEGRRLGDKTANTKVIESEK